MRGAIGERPSRIACVCVRVCVCFKSVWMCVCVCFKCVDVCVGVVVGGRVIER